MTDAQHLDMENFSLGKPALVCRWRLASGTLLLENRHLRALSRRIVNGKPVSPELVAWVKQHIEWTLAEGSAEHPDGVLMLIIDEGGAAAMAVGPYEPLRFCDTRNLIRRAREALVEQDETDVAPEMIFAHHEDGLLIASSADAVQSGCSALVLQLSATLGIPVIFKADLLDLLESRMIEPEGIFLASDEHGIVAAEDRADPLSEKFAASYQRLIEKEHRKRR